MSRLTTKGYQAVLKSFRTQRLKTWLDEWEDVMAEAIRHDLAETKDGRWLIDLADLVKPASDTIYNKLLDEANDEEMSKPQGYRRVAQRLRERLETRPGGRTLRGGAFNASFADQEVSGDSGSDATMPSNKQAEPGKASPSKTRKRAGTKSLEADASKKTALECPVCGIRGHVLPDCWTIFEFLRPEGFKPSAFRVRKANRAIKTDEELRKQVEQIKLERKQAEDE
jgi:hypothetical protein